MTMTRFGTARALFEGEVLADSTELGPLMDLAKDLARLEAHLSAGDRRSLEVLALSVLEALAEGSTRAPLEGELPKDLRTVSKDPNAYAPLIVDRGHVYTQRMLLLEKRVASLISARASAFIAVDRARLTSATAEVAERPFRLSPEQRHGIERAMGSGLTVISGGPGTGKTSVIFGALRALIRVGVEPEQIALAAPTGKAANRMDEAIRSQLLRMDDKGPEDVELEARCPRAQTLHRMLGYTKKGEWFRHDEDNRLPERVVIVDESSMIDLVLMDRLLRSLRGDARLILIGDADQLPSVDAGAVLRDISIAKPEVTVTLEENFRMISTDPSGRRIAMASRALAGGAASFESALSVKTEVEGLELDGIELLRPASAGARWRFLERWYVERTKGHRDHVRLTRRHYRFEGGAFHLEDEADLSEILGYQARFQILTVTQKKSLSTGASTVNAALHRRVLDDRPQLAAPFLVGEPIMMLRNDYERGLFNGDQGIILSVIADGRRSVPMAVFRTPKGLLPFQLDGIAKDLELAHAITVHKAQGSELDHVAFILPEVDVPILTSELVYTAVTRARRSVTIIGDRILLAVAVGRRSVRSSGLVERIREAGA